MTTKIIDHEKAPRFPSERKPERSYSCATCEFFSSEGVGGGAECRIEAPKGAWLPVGPGNAPALAAGWPPTRSDRWCGQWALRVA
jgi:hypothetical protein